MISSDGTSVHRELQSVPGSKSVTRAQRWGGDRAASGRQVQEPRVPSGLPRPAGASRLGIRWLVGGMRPQSFLALVAASAYANPVALNVSFGRFGQFLKNVKRNF